LYGGEWCGWKLVDATQLQKGYRTSTSVWFSLLVFGFVLDFQQCVVGGLQLYCVNCSAFWEECPECMVDFRLSPSNSAALETTF
jgi:hypothetical protein